MSNEATISKVLSYYKDIKKRKFKVSITEQVSELQALARKFNKVTPRDDNIKKRLLELLKQPPYSLPKTVTKIPFTPFLNAPWNPNDPRAKTRISWYSDRGAAKSISLEDRETYIAYLEHLVGGGKEEEFGQEKKQEDQMVPQPTLDPNSNSLYDAITGEKLPEQWLPYQPDSTELENFEYVYNGVVPEVEVGKLLDLITGDPNASTLRVPILEWKRKIRNGADPTLIPEVQKELFDMHARALGICKQVQADKDGKRYIDRSSLSIEDKILLSTITARSGGFAGKMNCAGLYIGKEFSNYESIAPNLWKIQGELTDKTGVHDRYGITFGLYTQPICDFLRDVKFKESDGTYTGDVLNSSEMKGNDNRINRVIALKNEKIMKAIINKFFANDPEANVDLALETKELDELVTGLSDYADAIEQNLPVGGVMSTEDGLEAKDNILGGMAEQNIQDPVREHIFNLYRQVGKFMKIIQDSGVKVAFAEHTGSDSHARKKDDFVINLPTPEDAAKFSAYAKGELGLDFDFNQTSQIPISLKCIRSFSNILMGAAGMNKVYGYPHDYHKNLPSFANNSQAEYHSGRDNTIDYFSNLTTNKQFKSLAKDGIERSSRHYMLINQIFEPITRLGGKAPSVSLTPLDNHVKELTTNSLDDKRAYSSLRERAANAKMYVNPKDIEEVKKDLFNFVRYLETKKDPKLAKSYAYADLMSTFTTDQEELIWVIHGNKSLMTSNYNITKHLIEESIPEYSFYGGRVSLEFKDKEGFVLAKPQFTTTSSESGGKYYTRYGLVMNRRLMDHIGIELQDKQAQQSNLTKEEVIRKFEKLIEVIEKAVR